MVCCVEVNPSNPVYIQTAWGIGSIKFLQWSVMEIFWMVAIMFQMINRIC